jgi:hypothetical protein
VAFTRTEDLEASVGRLLREEAPRVELRRAEDAVLQAQYRAGITQQERARLNNLQMKIALVIHRMSTADTYRLVSHNQGHTEGALLYKPSGSSLLHVPPVSHSPGATLRLQERFRLEMVNQSFALAEAPQRIEYRGVTLNLAGNYSRPTSVSPQLSYFVESPYRLPASGLAGENGGNGVMLWPVLLAVPCTEEPVGTGAARLRQLPDCFEPVEPPALDAGDAFDCDLDGDGRIDSSAEYECLEHRQKLRGERRPVVIQ